MTPQKTLDEYMKKETQSTTKQQPAPHHEILEFYRETEFQETEIGKIPRGWNLKKLSEIALEMYYGLTAKATDYPTGIRMLRTTDIKENYKVDWDTLPYCEITDNRRNNIQRFLIRKNELLVSRSGTTGMSVLVDRDFDDVVFGSYLIKIRLNELNAYPRYVHYYMQSKYYWNQVLPKQAGSTLKNISLPILKNIVVPLPPINEQMKIAEVLSTVDNAIELYREKRVRLERLKRALMRELLTGRVRVREENGKLVFYRETEFQETELGKIPREWKVKKLGEIAIEMYYGLTAKAVEQPTGMKMVRTTDIKETYSVDWNSLPYCEITDNRHVNIQKYLLRKNDLLVSRSGTTGMSVLVDRDFDDVIFGSYLIKVRVNELVAYPKYVHYYMQSQYYWNQILPRQAGSTLKNISLPILKNIIVPLPPMNEQMRITEILLTIDKAIELYHEKKVRFERLKRGLMDLLLTGKVRVRIKPAS